MICLRLGRTRDFILDWKFPADQVVLLKADFKRVLELWQSSSSSVSLVPCSFKGGELLNAHTPGSGLLLKRSRKCVVQQEAQESFALVVTYLPYLQVWLIFENVSWSGKIPTLFWIFFFSEFSFSEKKIVVKGGKKRNLGTRLISWYIGTNVEIMTISNATTTMFQWLQKYGQTWTHFCKSTLGTP